MSGVWQYRVTADNVPTGTQVNWTHLSAINACRENRGGHPTNTVLRIERRRENARMNGAWLIHRVFVIGPGGIATRTDKTKPHESAS